MLNNKYTCDLSTNIRGGAVGTLLKQHQLFQTNDVDEAREIVSRVYCDHTLNLTQSKDFRARQNRLALKTMSVNYMEYGTDVNVDPGYLKDFFLLQFPLEGAAEINTGADSFETDQNVSSIINPTDYTKMGWNAACKKLMVQIECDAVQERLARILMCPADKPLLFKSKVINENSYVMNWWRQIRHIVTDADGGIPLWHTQQMIESQERHILTSLLYSFEHNYTEILAAQDANVTPKHVKLARDYIQAHLRDSISVDDLVHVTGVSQRSLFEGFKKFMGTTPMKYILQQRMEKARNELLTADPSTSVTEVATKWGFFQLGRFAVTYKKVFGESPSFTLRNH